MYTEKDSQEEMFKKNKIQIERYIFTKIDRRIYFYKDRKKGISFLKIGKKI